MGKNHPDYASALFNYAALLASQGEHEEALRLQRQAAAAYEARMGSAHTNMGILLLGIAYERRHHSPPVTYRIEIHLPKEPPDDPG